ncbi:MAG: biotin transporter BioY [Anaerolineae bacterium]|nr:biotin transporter BioY [Anaerolineae bacterium]
MLRTIPLQQANALNQRVLRIALFTGLIVLATKAEIWFGGPVPFTLQVLAVLLAGMLLGARDGALSVVSYLGLIVINLPVDSAGVGAVAFAGPTAGYLVGFVPAAFTVGWLVERSAKRTWQQWLAGVVGIAVIYAIGLPWLKLVTGGTWSQAWQWGAYPFLGLDLLKALLAALLVDVMARFISR